MADSILSPRSARVPAVKDIIQLTKPVTWFPPMWAFMCGVVSSGISITENWLFLVVGIALTGPIVCGTSQVINDWCDRHVDAINEPDRPIPSGRVPGLWPVWIALAGSAISLAVAAALGTWVLLATCVALFFGWAYSSPPFRFKRSGWIGPMVCALSYEGLSWFTGASVMAGGLPPTNIIVVLLLYSLGAHGIMTLNDFKAVEGDRATGLRSLPVTMGVRPAALLACGVMAGAQFAVIALLIAENLILSASVVGLFTAIQLGLMVRLVGNPAKFAPWYNATGVSLYVFGMLAAALGLGNYI
ncbi:MAG: chlorophyll synthase ChlG [Sphingomonadales bacterium]|nr:chlorophyll synthase ChlG [Sphingomonadales bacterium]NCO48848.1 chlorophyll synthase ChlG [Sphingomonadales bacterium]NCO99393.1 chlorophyll synthase ChlG [Sphingomonadales bacterium]NCP27018.1 chlorophyll synthase ChlG [Sphingomonadales bacterium]NCP42284.1 chlorophyll synthase ChlG [Sphingomonadales bacterium]